MIKLIKIFFFTIIYSYCLTAFTANQYHFNKIDNINGLSNNHVQAILKDNQGFMWFGTMNGLNRYDGYSIKTYKNIPGDTNSIIGNQIIHLFLDEDNKIWVETSSGICIYNSEFDSFDTKEFLFKNKYYIPGINTSQILIDTNKNTWLAHYNSGLYLYNKKTEDLFKFESNSNNSLSISSNAIKSIDLDSKNNIWLISETGLLECFNTKNFEVIYRYKIPDNNLKIDKIDYQIFIDNNDDIWIYSKSHQIGLFYFNISNKSIINFRKDNPQYNISNDIITSVIQSDNGKIWCGTDHGGINIINKKDFTVKNIIHSPFDGNSLSQDVILKLYKDNDGIIWIGTYKKGINYYHESFNKFSLYANNPLKKNSLPYNDINCFAEDDKNNIWIGTNGEGLIYFDRKNNKFTQYIANPDNPNSLSSNVIVSLCNDSENRLWIGTFHGGLNILENGNYTIYKNDIENKNSISSNHVWKIIEDSKQNIWLATLGGGLELYNPELNSFTHYKSDDINSVHSNVIITIYEDSKSNIWIGTSNGLNKYNRETGRFTHYIHNSNVSNSISNNLIYAICEDDDKNIWIGTSNGLNLLSNDLTEFKNFKQADGLPDDIIFNILKDDKGDLWMSTTNGISKLIIKTDTLGKSRYSFINFNISDGLQGKAFNEGAACKTSKGEFLFGGANGFNLFYPNQITIINNQFNIIISNLLIFNKNISVNDIINGRKILNKSINYTEEINLKYKENVITFGFTALNYFHQEKRKFKYKLEGFNESWLETSVNQRSATYTNLDPGEYFFKVKATNNEGKWTYNEASIKLIIQPPWYLTKYAIFSYIILTILLFILIKNIIVSKIRTKRKIEIERLKAKNIHETDMMKLRFFTNISHEFKTPLTLIISPLEKLIKIIKEESLSNQLILIYNNALRLLRLVNQLMDFRKLEAGGLKLQTTKNDIVLFINKISDSFKYEAKERNIDFKIHSKSPELELWYDKDKMEKILYNVISNAFKYTPDNGKVAIKIKSKIDDKYTNTPLYHHFEFVIENTGPGIQKDKTQKIFDRFYQLKKSGNSAGTGIGLTLTKELVELHYGKIEAKSIPGKNTKFIILLPLDNKHLNAYEIAEKDIKENTQYKELQYIDQHENIAEESLNQSEKPILLIIEDNSDLRMFIKQEFSNDFEIAEANNGLTGNEKALELMPDIIICDILMPGMSGIELCKNLKNNELSSHIPIIILTSQSEEDQIIKGYETGADDYITKPFSISVLRARINNIITSRKKLQDQFKKVKKLPVKVVTPSSLDQKFLEKIAEIVDKNIGNNEFDATLFSQEIGMSRAQLYRKMKSLTGFSVNEYIRNLRLNKSVELLLDKNYNVNEAAYSVGFNQVSYFTKCFTEYYGVSPTKYIQMNKQL